MRSALSCGVVGDSPVPGINQVARDSVGWPTYVRQIGSVYAALPIADRVHAVIVASNYGEAGAVDRYGSRYALPRVYSGQNQLYYQARSRSAANRRAVGPQSGLGSATKTELA
jgi:hypothetical protein